MDAFEAYKTYVAIKNHFTSRTYDYFKYGGKTKAARSTFEKRNDKYFFHKLGKKKDVVEYLVANFAYGNHVSWVGDFLNNEVSEQRFLKFLKVKESLSYVFSQDLDRLDLDFDSNFQCIDGHHPPLLKLYLQGSINIETLVILDDLVSFSLKWTRRIEEKVIWPEVNHLCKKYRPFMTYDKEKMKKLVLEKFS